MSTRGCIVRTVLAAIPNDPSFDELWGLHNTGQTGTPGAGIRAVAAWDLWTGDPDLRIAVLDTAVPVDYFDSLSGGMSSNGTEVRRWNR